MVDEYGHIILEDATSRNHQHHNDDDNSVIRWYENTTVFQAVTFIFAFVVALLCFIVIVPFLIKGGIIAKIMVCGGVFLGWWVYTTSVTEVMSELNISYYTGWLYIKSFLFTFLGGLLPGLAYYFFPEHCTVIFIIFVICNINN